MMKKLLSVLVYLAIACSVVNAQNIDEIISRYYENMGGLDKLKALKTLKLIGKMPGPMGELSMIIYKKSPNLSRTEIDFQGQKMIQACDGKTAWAINPMMGSNQPKKLEGEMAKTVMMQSTFEDPIIDYSKKGHEVTFEGKETIGGSECYKIKIVLNKNNDQDDITNIYYLDSEYMMPVLMKSFANGQEIETYMSDYQDIKDGMMMAFKMDIKLQGKVVQSIVIDSAEVGIEIDDNIFKFPGTDN